MNNHSYYFPTEIEVLSMQRMGPIIIVEGPNNSKVPFSRSLYIDCEDKVLIDTGADPKLLIEIEEQYGVNLVVNTHYHPDHTLNNHLFKSAEKWINPYEFETVQSIEGIAKGNGVFEEWGPAGVEKMSKQLPQKWVKNLGSFTGSYQYDKEYYFGDVKTIFLHMPGHTKGYSCPYFPELGIIFVGDFDMTSFGPWYFGSDGSIDEFIQSSERLLTTDADTFITGHHKGIFTKREFQQAMADYLAVIDKRDHMIEEYVQKGMNFDELTSIGIFYPKNMLDSLILKTWERTGTRKHLHRLGYEVQGSDIVCVKVK
nr:MBL fold metallo-hydrolase [Neobacillus sp. Marseille-Q6967]